MNYLEFMARVDSLGPLDNAQLPVTMPAIIDFAEQRIYRELDLLAASVTDASLSLSAGVRTFAFTANTPFVTLMKVNLLSGNGASQLRTQMEPVSRDLLDAVFGDPTPQALPRWFAMVDAATINVGPWPDQAYGVEIVGKVRPAPLYTLGPTGSSFLSTYLPDLFTAAAMAYVSTISGKPQNVDAMRRPVPETWEMQYQALKASAAVEEARRAFMGPGWSSLSAPAGASATR